MPKRPDQVLASESTIENRVTDSVGRLTEIQKKNIFNASQDLEQNVGSEIAILIVDTFSAVEINQFSMRAAEDLGLGRVQQKDAILITIADRDRKARIEVGNGLAKITKDEIAK